MPRMQIVADARWLSRTILDVLIILGLVLLGVYMFAGVWWTIATVLLLAGVFILVWRVLRS